MAFNPPNLFSFSYSKREAKELVAIKAITTKTVDFIFRFCLIIIYFLQLYKTVII